MQDFVQRLTSRRFILAVIAGFVAFGNAAFDWGLTTEQVTQVLWPLIAFIVGESAADAVGRVKAKK